MPKHCSSCGAQLTPTAKFCHRCGAPVDGSVAMPAVPPRATGGQPVLPWAVAAIALLCLLAFIVGQNWRRRQAAPTVANALPATTGATGPRAVDISQMTPDERADRLFNRVMTYVTDGKSDSVRFFAPMAIQSFEALAPLNAHRRYDLGLLGVVSGDGALARAQADTILREQPSHLLGLILGMRAAGLQLDTLARARYAGTFSSVLQAERAKRLPEYLDHAPDIDAAVRDVDSRSISPNRPN
jgi:hypothetical protein